MKEQVTLKKHDATTSTVTLTSDGWRVERKKNRFEIFFSYETQTFGMEFNDL